MHNAKFYSKNKHVLFRFSMYKLVNQIKPSNAIFQTMLK